MIRQTVNILSLAGNSDKKLDFFIKHSKKALRNVEEHLSSFENILDDKNFSESLFNISLKGGNAYALFSLDNKLEAQDKKFILKYRKISLLY